jgi:uncharacterized protein involved in type VI secretion and phage assembly
MVPYFHWAIVTDNADPDGLHRVKVAKKNEDESVTEWIPVLTPYGSTNTGLSMLPEVDDQVLVVSLDASDNRKAVIGTSWSNELSPPETGENTSADLNSDGKNSLRFFKSRAGNQLIFDDTDSSEKIQLIAAGGKTRFEFSAKDELVTFDTDNDIGIGAKGTILIQAEEVEVISKKQFNVSTEEFQLEAEKGLDINCDQDITIEGSGVSIN